MRAVNFFPRNPITGEPALDMDPTQNQMPLLIGQTFTFNGQTMVITQLERQQSQNGDEYILVWVDLV